MSIGLPLRRDSAPDGQPRAVRLRRLRTFGLGFLVLSDAAYTTTALDMRLALAEGTSTVAGRSMHAIPAMLGFAMFALSIGVAWRRRFPVALTIVGLGVALVGQLGPTVALIGLMSVLLWRPRVDAWRLGPLVLIATGVAVWRDLETLPRTNSFWGSMLSLGVEPVPWFVPVVLTLALFGSFVGIGLWLRTRADLRTAEVVVAEERDAVTSLTDQVSRQAERERLAREIHDGLGHNLSILSVHAGALQAMADATAPQSDTDTAASQMRESAQVVRETAARSVSELHTLLDLLRNPGDADVAAPTRTLRDVRALIDDSVTAGMPLIATVFVDDGEALDPHIAQAAYRIVQELLTNARKHAATVPVRLSITGGPTEGHLVIATGHRHRQPPPASHRAPEDGRGSRRPGVGAVRRGAERRPRAGRALPR